MSDDLMKLMGWLDVTPQFQGLDAIVNPGLAPKVRRAINSLQSTSFHAPAPVNVTGRITVVSASAATAPGSTRRANSYRMTHPNGQAVWMSGSGTWTSSWDDDQGNHWTKWGAQAASCTFATSNYSRELLNRLFGTPGRTITAASDLEDEPAQPGFQATGPRDDFAGHMAYKGLKPGTPEWDDEARAWVRREEWKRVGSGELERASRLAVRDAHLERYKQTDADRLIEEMMT